MSITVIPMAEADRPDTETLQRVRDGLLLHRAGTVLLPSRMLDDLDAVLDEDATPTPREIAELRRRLGVALRRLLPAITADAHIQVVAYRLLTERIPSAESLEAVGHVRRLALCVLCLAEHAAAGPMTRGSPSGTFGGI